MRGDPGGGSAKMEGSAGAEGCAECRERGFAQGCAGSGGLRRVHGTRGVSYRGGWVAQD